MRRPVADPVRPAVDDVIDVLAGLEGDHHLLVELAEGGVHHVDRAARQLLELLGVQRHRLAHHGHGVGQDGDLVPGVVLRVGGRVRTDARMVFLDPVLRDVVGLREGGHGQGHADRAEHAGCQNSSRMHCHLPEWLARRRTTWLPRRRRLTAGEYASWAAGQATRQVHHGKRPRGRGTLPAGRKAALPRRAVPRPSATRAGIETEGKEMRVARAG